MTHMDRLIEKYWDDNYYGVAALSEWDIEDVCKLEEIANGELQRRATEDSRIARNI